MMLSRLLLLVSILLFCACTNVQAPVPVYNNGQWPLLSGGFEDGDHLNDGFASRFGSGSKRADLYFFGQLRSNWDVGIDDPELVDKYKAALEELKTLEQRGRYKNVKFNPVQQTEIAGVPFRVISLNYVREGVAYDSITYMTALAARIIKIRFTDTPVAGSDLDSASRVFMERFFRGMARR